MKEVIVIEPVFKSAVQRQFNDPLIDALQELDVEPVRLNYTEASQSAEQLQNARAVILAGAPIDYEGQPAGELASSLGEYLEDLRKPILGVCLGHQVLGLVYEAKLEHRTEEENGWITVEASEDNENDPIFRGLDRQFTVYGLHLDSISFPAEASEAPVVRLAHSLPSPGLNEAGVQYQVMRIGDKQVYGVQFHPERSGATGRKIIRNFLELQP